MNYPRRALIVFLILKDVSPQDPSWWQLHTPNYYFPKTTSYGDMGATSLVLCTAAFGNSTLEWLQIVLVQY